MSFVFASGGGVAFGVGVVVGVPELLSEFPIL
jgi:hypothetical protein